MFAGSGGEDIRVGLIAEDGMTPVFRAVADSAAVFTGSLERSMSGLARLGPAAAPVLLIAGAFVAAGTAASNVQQNVANLNAALNATPTQLKAIRDAGLQLAQQTQFTDAQIIESQRQLAKAHADTLAIIKETRDVTNLAGATQSTPLASATLLTTAQKAFGLGTNDSTKQSDILATSIDSSVGSANDLGVALKQVGPTARAAGLDLATFATATADLQNQGLRGSAGTAMQTFLQRIMRETPQAKAAIKDLGLEFYNSDQTLKPYADILDEIRIKTAGVSEETRNADLTAIFGQRGIKIADIAAESGSASFYDTKQHQDSLGTAAEINAKKLDTFQGSASRLASSVNTVGVQMGTVLLPEMKAAGDLGISLTNTFSTLNNNVAVLPQLLVGAGAVFGLSKVNNVFDARKQANAQPGIDAANKRAAIDANNAEARVKAEFSADSQIFAARQELDAKLQSIDAQRYDAWLALEEKTVAAVNEADERQLSSIDSITAAYMASIERIDRAQAAASAENLARMQIDADKQRALLQVNQEAATATARIPSSGPVGLAQGQQIERDALEKRILIEQETQGKLDQLRVAGYERQKDEAAISAQAQIDQKIAEQGGILDAIEVGQAKQEDALVASYAEQERLATEHAAKMEATARATAANALGTDIPSPGGAGALLPTPYEGSIGNGPIPIPIKGQVVAKEVTTEAGLGKKIGGALAGFGAAAGEFVLPALIAVTVAELVIAPIDQAIIDRAVNNDPQLRELTGNSYILDPSKGSPRADVQAMSDDIDKQIADTKTKIDSLKSSLGGGVNGILGFTDKDPFYKLAHDVGADALQKIGIDIPTPADLTAAEAKLSKLEDLKKKATTSLDFTAQGPVDQRAVSALADSYSDLEAKVSTGSLTLDQAEKQGQVLALQQIQLGASTDKVGESYNTFTKSLEDNLKARQEVAQQAELALNDNIAASQKNAALGLGDDLNAVASFGKHLSGSDATKAQIAAAKKDAADLESAWGKAATAIGAVDVSKGIDALAKQARALDRVVSSLDQLGQKNAALTAIDDLANSFKQITDEEDAANASLNGYMLTLNHTNDALSQIGSLQKGFTDALNAAETRVAQGIGTDKDAELIREAPSILGSLNTQKEKLSQNTDDDWLGIAANLPKWDQLDKDARSIVSSVGGGKQAYLDIETNAKEAQRQIDAIVNGPYDAKVNIAWVVDQQLQDFIKQQVADYNKNFPPPPATGTGDTYGAYGPYGTANRGDSPGTPPGGWGYQNLPPQSPGYTPSGANSPLAYKPLSPQDYLSIVRSSEMGKSNGPFEDPAIRDALLAAAQKANVDPRALLDITKWENNDAINISPDLNAANNFGGIKYKKGVNQDSGIQADNGGTYAKYDTPEEFFRALAANISTEEYKQDFDTGNFVGIRQRYVAGDAQPNYDQSKNITQSNADYWNWAQQYKPPVGAGAGTGPGMAAGDAALSVGGTLFGQGSNGGGASSDVLATAKQHLGQKLDDFGNNVNGECEQIVDDILAETGKGVTDFRKNSSAADHATADAHIRAAMAGTPGAGHVVSAQDAQPGDEVGWLGTSKYAGDPAGHIGVYSGNNQYIGTSAQGVIQRPLGPDAIFIRPDGVVAAGPEPGTTVASASGTGKTFSGAGGGTSGLPMPTYRDVSLDADRLDQLNRRSDPGTITAVQKFDQIATPILQKIQAMGMNGGAGPLTPFETTDAQQRGAQWGLKEDAAVQQYLLDVKNKTGDIHADIDQIVKGGGQMGEAFAAAAVNAGQIAAATEKQKADQAAVTAATQDWQRVQAGWQVADKGTQESRAAADLATQVAATKVSRKATTDEWRVADDRQKAQDGWKLRKDNLANLTQSENDAWQIKQETYSDELRMIQQNGTVAQRALEDQGLAIDRNHKAQIAGSTAYEQVLLAQSKASLAFGTPGGSAAAVQLASMKAGDQRSNDDYAKVKANLQDAITAQARLASDTAFNIQTQETLDQRAHDKTIRGYEDSLKAEQAIEDAKQQGWATDDRNLQRNQTLAQWKAEDERAQTTATRLAIDKQTAEERATATASHQQRMDNLNAEVTKDGEYLKGLQNTGTALDGIISNWQTLLPLVGQTGNSVLTWLTSIADQAGQPLNVDSALFQQQGAGLSTKAGVPYSQFPQPGAGRGYASGTDSATAGYHAVAEHGPELLFKGGERVLNSVDTTAFLNRLLAPTPISAAASWRPSSTVNLTIAGGSSLDDTAIANIRAFVKTEIAASEARQNPQVQGRSTGAMR